MDIGPFQRSSRRDKWLLTLSCIVSGTVRMPLGQAGGRAATGLVGSPCPRRLLLPGCPVSEVVLMQPLMVPG